MTARIAMSTDMVTGGGGAPDGAAVRGDRAAAGGVVGTRRATHATVVANVDGKKVEEGVSEKSVCATVGIFGGFRMTRTGLRVDRRREFGRKPGWAPPIEGVQPPKRKSWRIPWAYRARGHHSRSTGIASPRVGARSSYLRWRSATSIRVTHRRDLRYIGSPALGCVGVHP